jgi:hypothetical protein
MNQPHQIIYTGTDNTIELQLTEDGVPISDHTLIVAASVEIIGWGTITSAAEPLAFNFNNVDRLILKLGNAGIPTGRHWMRLAIVTAAAPNGIVWQPDVKVRVV